jgi:UDP-glucose 4-epimerase
VEDVFIGKRILITGGLGFIGSNLAHRLVGLGAKVVLVDSLLPQFGGNLRNISGIEDRVVVNIADVRDEDRVAYLVQNQDYLFNLAAQTSHLGSMQDPHTDLEINCKSQLSILEACRKNNPGIKIVFASTRQIYGVPEYLPVDEKHPVHPTDVYAINKMAGERYHILYNNVYGIRACALRMTSTYGPRMRVKDARQTFLGWWIRQALAEEEIQVYGDGSQLRDFNFVEDVVNALLCAASRDNSNGMTFNLGHSPPVSLEDVARLLIEMTGGGHYKHVPFPALAKAIDIGDYYGDCGLINKTLGWRPKVNLQEGLVQTIEYYRKNREYYWS